MVARLGGDPFAYRQAGAPLVAEVEHVADSLAEVEVELGEREPIPLGPAQHGLKRTRQRPSIELRTVGVAAAFDYEQPPDDLTQSVALHRPVLMQHLLDEQPRIAVEAVVAEVVVEQ